MYYEFISIYKLFRIQKKIEDHKDDPPFYLWLEANSSYLREKRGLESKWDRRIDRVDNIKNRHNLINLKRKELDELRSEYADIYRRTYYDD